MRNILLSDIDRDTSVQNAHPQYNLWGAETVLFDDDAGKTHHVVKHSEHCSEILLQQRYPVRWYSCSLEQ